MMVKRDTPVFGFNCKVINRNTGKEFPNVKWFDTDTQQGVYAIIKNNEFYEEWEEFQGEQYILDCNFPKSWPQEEKEAIIAKTMNEKNIRIGFLAE